MGLFVWHGMRVRQFEGRQQYMLLTQVQENCIADVLYVLFFCNSFIIYTIFFNRFPVGYLELQSYYFQI